MFEFNVQMFQVQNRDYFTKNMIFQLLIKKNKVNSCIHSLGNFPWKFKKSPKEKLIRI